MIEKFKIESESEADAFLRDLLSNQEYRSMNEVEYRAQELIINEPLRKYFMHKAQELLKVNAPTS
ncbi:hypothetical protein ACH5Y9_23980 [Methylomonas sp. BW4-1]|uniref:hypothetical protein n=1 Tax=Methylomonas sp. BW4-1 TaxID=3376685 RepID=UPI004041FC90